MTRHCLQSTTSLALSGQAGSLDSPRSTSLALLHQAMEREQVVWTPRDWYCCHHWQWEAFDKGMRKCWSSRTPRISQRSSPSEAVRPFEGNQLSISDSITLLRLELTHRVRAVRPFTNGNQLSMSDSLTLLRLELTHRARTSKTL